MSGKFLNDLSDDECAIDVSELPNEYRVKLNGFLRGACSDGYETLTRVLLDKGADVNYITTNTQLPTALHVAVANTKESILPILLPQASSATIQAALQYAISYQSRLTNVIRILQQDSSIVESSDNTKDKDKDKSAIDKVSQKETETQTTSPSHKENETQTNGSEAHGSNEPRHQTLATLLQTSSSPISTDDGSQQNSNESQQTLDESQQKDTPQQNPDTPQQNSDTSHQNSDKSQQPNDESTLQQQLQQQQIQLKQQQQQLTEQQLNTEQAQLKASHAQQAAQHAQHKMEEMQNQLQKQNDQIELQDRQVQKLNDQLGEQNAQAQKLSDQVSAQESLAQKLNEQLATHEDQTQKLSNEVHAQLDQIGQLKLRITQLESENKDLGREFASYTSKSEAMVQDLKNQTITLQKDIEAKTHKIEVVSSERDSERKAKDIAKTILLSDGPKDTPSLGQSFAIRMGSIACVSPTPQDEDDLARGNSFGKSRGATWNGTNTSPRAAGDAANDMLRRFKSDNQMVARISDPKRGLSSKSRSKDDMDIASEADKARVRRLVSRWEELKFIDLKNK